MEDKIQEVVIDEEELELEAKAVEFEWAESVLAQPEQFKAEEVEQANEIIAESADMWKKTVDDLDEILDIEDDDEREAAFQKWESANSE